MLTSKFDSNQNTVLLSGISHANLNTTEANLLRLEKITKVYPGIVANKDIDLTVKEGEIHAVLGENGAGKSTLMKIIYGVSQPTAGKVIWRGQEAAYKNPAEARSEGIGMVFQHFSLFETLSVFDNIYLNYSSPIAKDELIDRINEIGENYGLQVDWRRHVHSLSMGERQRVEIIRCLLQNPKLLIMDEPTSVLSPQAVEKLFLTIRKLADQGCGILYISHKLHEIRNLCHKATVLRNGEVTGDCIPANESDTSLARMMTGDVLPELNSNKEGSSMSDEVRLKVKNLNVKSDDIFGVDLKDINLEVASGEIVGIAGVSGNGQSELLYALSGESKIAEAGKIFICGKDLGRTGSNGRRTAGLAFVPEERLGRGAAPGMSLALNALLTTSKFNMVKFGIILFSKIDKYARYTIEKFSVKASGSEARADSLSGGNLQKFIVGREILQKPKLLILSQPTWGVDVGAAGFIHQSILDLASEGTAILLVSDELDEIFKLSNRIGVIANGELSELMDARSVNLEQVGLLMGGIDGSSKSDERHMDEEEEENESV